MVHVYNKKESEGFVFVFVLVLQDANLFQNQ